MLATLVIGLREGLEASLIVGIIAAFLTRSQKPLRPMWFGVGAAVLLSIAVGVGLEVISADLPQAQQEGMETIIGIVAVVFVTSMIGWMNTHARHLKSELEQSAASALRDGTMWALVVMAFLAVLKEGFETSVFLLAAFQSSTSALAAGAGAVLGVAISVAIGIGIYRGGIKLNLSKFFRLTGIFLVLVAAGLVLSAFRTAHEAGWVTIGQQTTVNLAWLAPNGSIQSALLTGVLGIPSDPRLIEVLAWAAYLVPVMLYLLWPVAKRPSVEAKPRFLAILAGIAAVIAVVLAVAVPLPRSYVAGATDAEDPTGGYVGRTVFVQHGSSYRLIITRTDQTRLITEFSDPQTKPANVNGIDARTYALTTTNPTSGTMTLDELLTLSGGRLPVGISAGQNPGPFDFKRNEVTKVTVFFRGGTLLNAYQREVRTVTLSGGGLAASRVITLDGGTSWALTDAYVAKTEAGVASTDLQRSELLLWKLWTPLALGIVAVALGIAALRAQRDRDKRRRAATETPPKATAVSPTAQPAHV